MLTDINDVEHSIWSLEKGRGDLECTGPES